MIVALQQNTKMSKIKHYTSHLFESSMKQAIKVRPQSLFPCNHNTQEDKVTSFVRKYNALY